MRGTKTNSHAADTISVSSTLRDLVIIFIIAVCAFIVAALFDTGNQIIAWIEQNEAWQADELIAISVMLVFVLGFVAMRRSRVIRHHFEAEKQATKMLTDQELELRHTKVFLENLIAISPEVVFQASATFAATYVSPNVERLWGYTVEEVMEPGFWLAYMHPEDREHFTAKSGQIHAEKAKQSEMEYRLLHKDGVYRWYRTIIRYEWNETGELDNIVGFSRDVTERKAVLEQLEHKALHDSLTGLPNRVLFMDRLEHALSRNHRQPGRVALLFLDLDDFKVINDSLGHKVGDQLLIVVSQRIQECLRKEDTVARLGGDEFTILIEDVKDPSSVTQVAEHIGQQLRAPVVLGGHDTLRTESLRGYQFNITASIGIALQSGDDNHPEDLLRQADAAMYEAKSQGKARYAEFEPKMAFRVKAHSTNKDELRRSTPLTVSPISTPPVSPRPSATPPVKI